MSIKKDIRRGFDFELCGKCIGGDTKDLCGVGQCVLHESMEIEKIDQLTRIADALEKLTNDKVLIMLAKLINPLIIKGATTNG